MAHTEPAIRLCPNPECRAQVEEGMAFCSACSTPLPPPFEEERNQGQNCPTVQILANVRLEYDCSRLLVSGKHGVIPLRFRNIGSNQPITALKLDLQCEACPDRENMSIDMNDLALAQGQKTNLRSYTFEVICKPGDYYIELKGHFIVNHEIPVAFRAMETLVVRDGNTSEGVTIKVNEGGILSAENMFEEGVDSIEVGGGGVVDLGKSAGPSTGGRQWVPLNLELMPLKTGQLEEYLNGQGPDTASPLPEEQPEIQCKAVWSIDNGDQADTRVIVYSGDEFTIGRDGRLVDLVACFLPATEENNKKSAYLSGKHGLLTVENDRVYITDLDSQNGIMISNRRIKKRRELQSGKGFSLANCFQLNFQEFRDIAKIDKVREIREQSSTVCEFSERIGELDIEAFKHEVPLDCFTLTRCDDFRNRLRYLFLRRVAMIGSSLSCALYLHHSSIARRHARLILMDTGFYLEALDHARETFIDDRKLYPGRPEPLPEGRQLSLRFGEIQITFAAGQTS